MIHSTILTSAPSSSLPRRLGICSSQFDGLNTIFPAASVPQPHQPHLIRTQDTHHIICMLSYLVQYPQYALVVSDTLPIQS